MSDDFRVQIIGVEQIEARLLAATSQVRARTRDTMRRLGLKLLVRVKGKLSGEVLRVRTGRLRRSVTEKFVDSGNTMTEIVGTNVSYGRFWELGFHGVVNVRSHLRRTLTGSTTVRAHTRNVNQVARPFLRPSFEEMRAEIRSELARAVRGGI